MAKYLLFVYAGKYLGKVIGSAKDITSARKMAYESVKTYCNSIDILDSSGITDVHRMRTVASVYWTGGHIAYSSNVTGKINKLTPNGAVIGFKWNEKDYVYPD